MEKVEISWERRAPVIERGYASVLVEDPSDLEQIKNAIAEQGFYEFLTTERTYEKPNQLTWERVTEE